jgi:hypothetical protein
LQAGSLLAPCLSALKSVSVLFPSRLQVVEHGYPDRASYRAWLIEDATQPFRGRFSEVACSRSNIRAVPLSGLEKVITPRILNHFSVDTMIR